MNTTLWRMLLDSRLWYAFRAILLLLLFGSVGYFVLGRMHWHGALEPPIAEPWAPLDCIYMTVITFSTIGYTEIFDTTNMPVVRIYTIGLILIGMLLVTYSVSSATAFFVSGDLQRLLVKRRSMKQIKKMENHYIVCGCGVTGRVILEELLATNGQVVVVDNDPSHLEPWARHPQVACVEGDATNDDVLREAGIERCSGLAAALPSDKDNLFLIVTARQLCPQARLASISSDVAVQEKLKRAGANAAVSSSFIGGLRLASELLRPAVVSFLDLMLREQDSPVRFAEVEIGPEWNGKRLSALQVRKQTGLPILAIRPPGQAFVFNPSPETIVTAGTMLVTMGEVSRVEQLDALCGDPDGPHILGEDDPPKPGP